MGVLGSLGQLYMFILLVLLFMGSGLALWSLINHLIKSNTGKTKPTAQQIKINENKERKILGGFKMANNGWFKLAIFSFIGILVSIVVLGVMTTNGAQANMNNNMQMQGNMYGNTQMQGNMNNNMQMQGNMNNNMQQMQQMQGNMPVQYNMNGNAQMSNDPTTMMMQQINQMQQQMNQMQQQIQQMNQMQQQIQQMNQMNNSGNGSMPSSGGSMPSGGGMGMM